MEYESDPSDESPTTSSDLTSTVVQTSYQFYIFIALLSLLCALGTAGNALVLFVFSRKTSELVSTLFIIALAFVDFVTCLLVIPLTLYMESVAYYVDSDLLCKFYHFMLTSNIPFSALVMVAIAVDRYLCICHPFVRAFSVKRAKLTVAVLGLAATCIGVCVALMYGVRSASPVNGDVILGNVTAGTNHGDGFDDEVGKTTMTMSIRAHATALSRESMLEENQRKHGRNLDEMPTVENHATILKNIVSNNVTRNFSDEDYRSGRGDTSELATVPVRRCQFTDAILSPEFVGVYQKCYTALFLLCFLAVVTLYVLIYRSVLQRRTRWVYGRLYRAMID